MDKPDWVKAAEQMQTAKPDWMVAEEQRQAENAMLPRRPEPGPPPTYMQVTPTAKAGAAVLAGLQAPARLGAGALQMLGINKPAEITEANSQYLKGIAGDAASVGETIGEIAPQMAFPGTRPLAMAAQGAATGMAQPNVDQGSLGSYSDMLLNKARQGLEGGVLGGLLGKVSQAALKPNVSPDLQKLQEMGMNRFTPGQLLSDIPYFGGMLRQTESFATSMPLTGAMIRKGLQTTNEDFNRAMANKVLEPLKIKVGDDVPAGRSLVEYLDDTIGSGYEKIKPKIDFKNVIDPSTGIDTEKHLLDRAIQVASGKPIDQQQTILNEFQQKFLDRFKMRNRLNGQEFRTIEQELGSTAKAYMSRPETQGVGFALREIQDALRNELINQNPAVGKELKNLHEAFKRYLRVERAASYVGAEEGVYSPSQMMSAVKSVGGQRPFATGQAMLQPETQTALNVIGPRTPDSGTAGRLQTGSLLGAGLDVGAQVATTGAPLAASALMYNPLAQRLLTNIATKRPQMMGPIQPAISRGAAGFGGSLSGPPNQGALP